MLPGYCFAGLIFSVLTASVFSAGDIRPAAVADKFYPGNREELSRAITSFIGSVPDEQFIKGDDSIYGIIVPHAGYVYSGQVAAYAYKLVAGRKYDTVVILGQSHNFPLQKSAVYTGQAFETPLGKVPVDGEFAGSLLKASPELFEGNNYAHGPEHSIEVQLPFLQSALKNFKIVPVLIEPCPVEKCEKIARVIAGTAKKYPLKKILLVMSSDMSHYPGYEDANFVDKEALKSLETFDPVQLDRAINKLMSGKYQNLVCVFCGNEAVYTGMYAAKFLGADKAKVIRYANSGDVSIGDKDRVVGYSASVLFKESKKAGKEKKNMANFSVNEKNQEFLLELARKTIKEYLAEKKVSKIKTEDRELLKPAAVFVTLTEKHNLRGCIGTTEPGAPLYEAVQRLALSAAFEDYRFGPVQKNELDDIRIEISVLSPKARVKSADEIKENIHGVIVRRGGNSGIFLPQVWEQIPDKEDFLGELCSQKAGLPRDAWKDSKTELYVFTVFAFEEK